jgi:nucleotide-binding universal stress UspA family protein
LAQFPLPAGSHLRVVSVVSISPSAADIPIVRDFLASLREEAQRTADGARAQLASHFAESDAQVLEGDARQAILEAAEEWSAELIVLGARGLGRLAGLLLGSVSLGVARHARCSVLVVRPGSGTMRGILIGIDGSEHAAAAAQFVARLPLDPMTVVRLTGAVHAPPVPATTPGFAKGMVLAAIAQIVRERTAALEQAMATAAASFEGVVKTIKRRVFVGHAVDGLLADAAAPDVGLVVVGARGLGTLQRLLLGSVSESLLRHADRPVLIVKRSTTPPPP